MKNTLILFFLLFPLLSFNTAHKFYVSVTEIEYNSKRSSLQIISRVFTDDMENLLKTRYNEDLFLVKEKEHVSADGVLQKYLSQKFAISIDGAPVEPVYLGKKYDNDQLVLFLEVEGVPDFGSITVENTVLTDLFPEQKNVVHVEKDGKTKSLLLSRNNARGRIKFGK